MQAGFRLEIIAELRVDHGAAELHAVDVAAAPRAEHHFVYADGPREGELRGLVLVQATRLFADAAGDAHPYGTGAVFGVI